MDKPSIFEVRRKPILWAHLSCMNALTMDILIILIICKIINKVIPNIITFILWSSPDNHTLLVIYFTITITITVTIITPERNVGASNLEAMGSWIGGSLNFFQEKSSSWSQSKSFWSSTAHPTKLAFSFPRRMRKGLLWAKCIQRIYAICMQILIFL